MSDRKCNVLWLVLLAAAGTDALTMGTRQTMGLFLSPLNTATGLGLTKPAGGHGARPAFRPGRLRRGYRPGGGGLVVPTRMKAPNDFGCGKGEGSGPGRDF
jgi:hypothetical protein